MAVVIVGSIPTGGSAPQYYGYRPCDPYGHW